MDGIGTQKVFRAFDVIIQTGFYSPVEQQQVCTDIPLPCGFPPQLVVVGVRRIHALLRFVATDVHITDGILILRKTKTNAIVAAESIAGAQLNF